ncbi:MAG TPA: hypothetical protein VJN18_35820 [Polyangiaceae bacterium]|nr:hypothetical protein [Polyangiaceae bacterium]
MSAHTLWYAESEKPAAASAMVNAARSLWADQGDQRRRDADDAMTLWAGTTNHGFSGSNPLSVLGLIDDTAGYNVVQAVTDTKVNTTLRNEIRPLLVTEGGDSELREKVEAMQDAADGQSYDLGLDDDVEEASCWNGYIFGNGGVEFWSDIANSRIVATPCYHWQYFVSRQEARAGKPQQLFSRHVMPRDVLASFLRDESAEIRKAVEEAPSASADDTREYQSTEPGKVVDLVVIWKGWHLPSGRVDLSDPKAFGKGKDGQRVKPSHDGRHMVCIEGAGSGQPTTALIDRPWPYDHYPISWFKPNRVPGSYWGRGEPEIIARSQIEMNQWNERIYQVLDHYARPAVILPKGAKLNPAQINNALFNIWQVEGGGSNQPQIHNQPAVPQDLVARLDRLPAQVRDQRGMSEMSMAARKPVGVDHKPGLAYLQNTETIRHTAEFRAWRRFKLDCYRNILRCFKELSEHDPNFEVVYERDEQLVRAKMTTINIDSAKYRLKAKATNLFSQDPAQQADQIADFVDRGLLPPKALFDTVKSPDLQALADDKEVMRKNAIKRVKDVIRGPAYNEALMPNPYMDLETCKQEALKAYNKLQLNDEREDKQDRVIAFLQDVDKLLGIGQAPGAGGPMASAPAPMPQQAANIAASAPAVNMPPAAMPPDQMM